MFDPPRKSWLEYNEAARNMMEQLLIEGMLQNTAMSAKERHELENGDVLTNVHRRGTCSGTHCAIHNPSDHPLKDAPRSWQLGIIWRTCDHGYDHPDYDSLAFVIDRNGSVELTHYCCMEFCCGLPEYIKIDD